MIQTIALMAGLSCPNTTIINSTATWTEVDQQHLTQATRRCGEIFPEAPCLKVFRKKEELLYNAICGKEI